MEQHTLDYTLGLRAAAKSPFVYFGRFCLFHHHPQKIMFHDSAILENLFPFLSLKEIGMFERAVCGNESMLTAMHSALRSRRRILISSSDISSDNLFTWASLRGIYAPHVQITRAQNVFYSLGFTGVQSLSFGVEVLVRNRDLEILSRLTELTHLHISRSCYISDQGLYYISKISSLRSIHISRGLAIDDDTGGFITNIGVHFLSSVPNLIALTIKVHNHISSIELQHFRSLTALVIERADVSRLQSARGSKLTTLVLSNCKITHIDRVITKDLQNSLPVLHLIEHLYLNWNQIVSLDGIESLTALFSLNLYGNQIRSLQSLSGLTQLRSLSLGSNPIVDDELLHLSRLTRLGSLELGICEITDGGLQHLANLVNLQSLDLHGNNILGFELHHLSSLTALKSLDLAETDIPVNVIKEHVPSSCILYGYTSSWDEED